MMFFDHQPVHRCWQSDMGGQRQGQNYLQEVNFALVVYTNRQTWKKRKGTIITQPLFPIFPLPFRLISFFSCVSLILFSCVLSNLPLLLLYSIPHLPQKYRREMYFYHQTQKLGYFTCHFIPQHTYSLFGTVEMRKELYISEKQTIAAIRLLAASPASLLPSPPHSHWRHSHGVFSYTLRIIFRLEGTWQLFLS